MILAQVFKTSEGARKRAAFENAHRTPGNRNMRYGVVRFFRNQLDREALQESRYPDYTWRIEKKRRDADD
jgi:hypothetical protein